MAETFCGTWFKITDDFICLDVLLNLRIISENVRLFFLFFSFLNSPPPLKIEAARFEMCYLDLECKCFVQEEEGSARSLKATSFWLMSFEMALQEQ